MPGEMEPEAFWLPVLGDRFGLKPWDMTRVRVAHFDAMVRYVREVPSFG